MKESRLMQLLKAMHEKFQLVYNGAPRKLSTEEKAFRVKALREEIEEYEAALYPVDEYDALLDMIVFAVGTLERQGFPLLPGFEAVIAANMQKRLASSSEESKRGFSRDLVKPTGWVGPEAALQKILEEAASIPNLVTQAPEYVPPGHAPKFDSNKTRVDLLPPGVLNDVAEVLGFGAKKYAADSWRTGETVAWSRTYGSVLRHLFAWWSGEDKDPETGLSHLAHACTQLMFLIEHEKYNKDKDDRFKRVEPPLSGKEWAQHRYSTDGVYMVAPGGVLKPAGERP